MDQPIGLRKTENYKIEVKQFNFVYFRKNANSYSSSHKDHLITHLQTSHSFRIPKPLVFDSEVFPQIINLFDVIVDNSS